MPKLLYKSINILNDIYKKNEDGKLNVIYRSLHVFDNISIGCEIGKYGDYCISCQGCQTCNIESGKCGMFFT